MNAVAILDQEFLAVRARLLEVAAMLDRLDRAAGSDDADDRRVALLRRAMQTILDGHDGDRAEQLQLLFSRPYDEDWRAAFQLTTNN